MSGDIDHGGLDPYAASLAAGYLNTADRYFGDRLVGFYLVGSAALGGFRRGQSDLDFVAVLDESRVGDVALIRKVHRRAWVRALGRAVVNRDLDAGACNGTYIASAELTKPVTDVVPIASQVAHQVHTGGGFDVNPVQWKTFAECGITLRGPRPSELHLQPQPELLRQWVLDNLNSYWTWSSKRCATGRSPNSRFHSPRWVTAWGVTGPARMHATVATGAVISKQAACEYALERFDPTWYPIVNEALAYLRGEPADPAFRDPAVRYRATGQFGLHAIAGANAL
ncbi:MAG: DUF4111 domain-containing protein [Gemmatimonadaceae bacterium]|nr:DUF4111 domain-containing protein [Gemmatimonadaceae bacterium]